MFIGADRALQDCGENLGIDEAHFPRLVAARMIGALQDRAANVIAHHIRLDQRACQAGLA